MLTGCQPAATVAVFLAAAVRQHHPDRARIRHGQRPGRQRRWRHQCRRPLNTNRAPDPSGHGPVGAPETLTVNIAKGATLTAGLDIRCRTGLTINGGDQALFNATDTTVEGGTAVIHTPLGGQGTIFMTNGPIGPAACAVAGFLEPGSSVGAGDTIEVRMGHLQIDKPPEFAGWVDLLDNTAFASGDRYSFGPRSILLKNIYATSFSFDDGSHVLTLFRGSDVVDQLRFTPGVTASFFEDNTALPGDTNVARTDYGVFIRSPPCLPDGGHMRRVPFRPGGPTCCAPGRFNFACGSLPTPDETEHLVQLDKGPSARSLTEPFQCHLGLGLGRPPLPLARCPDPSS